MVVLTASTVVRRPGYWKEPLLANVLVEISTGTVPPAPEASCHAAYFFDVSPGTIPTGIISRPLRHSAICEDAAVVSTIGTWIGDGVRP
jgi:hypothetical protein